MHPNVIIRAHEDHVLQRTALLKFFRRKRGERKTADHYMIPLTTNRDIAQLLRWWDAEFRKSRASRDWYKDGDKRQWLRDRETIAADLQGAPAHARYKRNAWFWNRAILKLAILLQVAKTRPSPTEMFMEAIEETVAERVQDADTAVDRAGEAARTVVEASGRAWSTLKIAGLVAVSAAGAAIVLPPVIRAFRD